MRSRFSAFALGLGRYLVDTMARTGPALAAPVDDLVRELGRVKETQRFMGLRIIHTHADGDRGEVMFYARIFERGVDRSFVELSRFVREDGKWTYVDGELVAKDELPKDPSTITREEVDAVLTAARTAAAAEPESP